MKPTSDKSILAIGEVLCSIDRFVVTESLYLSLNFCAEKPGHRKSAKRYLQF
jgi:hypothetical protein